MPRSDGSRGRMIGQTECIICPLGGEATNATVADDLYTFRMPYNFKVTKVKASAATAPAGSALTIDVEAGGTSIFDTLLTMDDGEATTATAATAAVLDATASDVSADAVISCNIDTIGSGTAGAGVKVYLIGHRTAA